MNNITITIPDRDSILQGERMFNLSLAFPFGVDSNAQVILDPASVIFTVLDNGNFNGLHLNIQREQLLE